MCCLIELSRSADGLTWGQEEYHEQQGEAQCWWNLHICHWGKQRTKERELGKVDQAATFQIIWDTFWNLTKIQLTPFSRKPHDARSTAGSSSEETDVPHGIRMLPCPCTNPVSFSWRAQKRTNKAVGIRQGKQQASYVRERKKALHFRCTDPRAVCRCIVSKMAQ